MIIKSSNSGVRRVRKASLFDEGQEVVALEFNLDGFAECSNTVGERYLADSDYQKVFTKSTKAEMDAAAKARAEAEAAEAEASEEQEE